MAAAMTIWCDVCMEDALARASMASMIEAAALSNGLVAVRTTVAAGRASADGWRDAALCFEPRPEVRRCAAEAGEERGREAAERVEEASTAEGLVAVVGQLARFAEECARDGVTTAAFVVRRDSAAASSGPCRPAPPPGNDAEWWACVCS